MPTHASAAELRDWMEGHAIANARQRERVARMSADEKLRQISRLMVSAKLFDRSRRQAGEERVRELWQRLRSEWPHA